jgi:multiple sugar transport system permease protein
VSAALSVKSVAPSSARRLSWPWRRRLAQMGITAALLLLGLFFIFPYYYMAISSLRAPFFNFDTLRLDLLPRPVSLAGYRAILDARLTGTEGELGAVSALARGLANTLFQEITILVGVTITSLLAAYAFAKTRFGGRGFFFYLLLAGMIIPAEVTMVPKFVMFTNWKFVGTHWALIVPAVLSAGGWFLMRMFMSTIPNAYIDAARIDGASELRIVRDVIAPLCMPAILTNGLFTFLGIWNDLIGPLMYVNSKGKYTLQMVIYAIQVLYRFDSGYAQGDVVGTRIQSLFAGLLLGSLPTIVVFILFQRHITEGTVITGLKI